MSEAFGVNLLEARNLRILTFFLEKKLSNLYQQKVVLNCTAVHKKSQLDDFLDLGETFLGIFGI